MMDFVVLLTVGTLFNTFASDVLSQDSAVIESRSVSTETVSAEETVSVEETATQAEVQEAPGGENDHLRDVKVRGQIIVIDPDGKKREFEFNGTNPHDLMKKFQPDSAEMNSKRIVIIHGEFENGKGFEQARKGTADSTLFEERFVIGIQCAEADDLLRLHLRLGEKGIVVINVRENTPAATGGLEKNDIIVSIDNRDVVSREDLTKAVLESEGKPLALSIIRAGEPQLVTVSPAKLKVPIVVASATTAEEELKELSGSGKGGVRFQLVHPGILLERGIPRDEADFRMMIEQFRKAAGEQAAKGLEHGRDAKEQAHELRSSVAERDEHLHEGLKTLQREVQELRKELSELRKQIKNRQ